MRAAQGEPPVRTAASASRYGFGDVFLDGAPLALAQPLGTHIVSNVLLKPAWPAEYHAQSALEAALVLRRQVDGRWDDIAAIDVDTHEAAVRIIDKTGPLSGSADRDHCLQYIVAAALLTGEVNAATYHDEVASDPRIDQLRARIRVREEPSFSRAYHDPEERAVASQVRVHFTDGTSTEPVTVRFPVGHPRRRDEARRLVDTKLAQGLELTVGRARATEARELLGDTAELAEVHARTLIDCLVPLHNSL